MPLPLETKEKGKEKKSTQKRKSKRHINSSGMRDSQYHLHGTIMVLEGRRGGGGGGHSDSVPPL